MRRLAGPLIALVVIAALGLLARVAFRSVAQYHATYPGPVTFVGKADGAFGTQYYRAFMWRAPADQSPLPDVAIYVKGTRYALADLTDELMQSLGGTAHEGGLKDPAEFYFQYRFENGRLTYFSLFPSWNATPPSSALSDPDRFFIQVGDGPPFTLPVSAGQLKHYAGEPLDVSAGITN
ncbi:MAG: hypothetical protein AMXMBFR82_08850 [Candidatus Hydrogenedentota bacterium]